MSEQDNGTARRVRIDPPRVTLRAGYKRPDVRPVPGEHPIRTDEFFFSTTNPKGIIQCGNSVFYRISGYAREDLVGAPHNMVRHPEMPRSIFKLLWNTIEDRRPLTAYVMNMSRDGKAYWVLANVFPVIVDGEIVKFTSVRLRALSRLFETVPDLYRAVREAEQSAPAADKGGMEAGSAKLAEGLAAAGFADYGAFMSRVLLEESRALVAEEREAFPVRDFPASAASASLLQAYPVCHRASSRLSLVLKNLEVLRTAMDRIEKLRSFTGDFAYRVRLLSLNTVLTSSAAGREGATIGIIAQNILECSRDTEEQARLLDELALSVRAPLESTINGVVFVKFQLLMVFKFLEETLVAGEGMAPEVAVESESSRRDLLHILLGLVDDVVENASHVQEVFQKVLRALERQSQVVRRLMSSQNFGRLQTVHATAKRAALETLFREIRACGEEARATIDDLVVDFQYTGQCFDDIRTTMDRVRTDAETVRRLIA